MERTLERPAVPNSGRRMGEAEAPCVEARRTSLAALLVQNNPTTTVTIPKISHTSATNITQCMVPPNRFKYQSTGADYRKKPALGTMQMFSH